MGCRLGAEYVQQNKLRFTKKRIKPETILSSRHLKYALDVKQKNQAQPLALIKEQRAV
jgi:hypothetical protein